MKYNEIEVLAPAGSPAIAKAVVAAGADAVYFAGNAFGARAYAPNFTRQEAADMLDFVHLRRKKAYLAVNTLLKNTEIERQLYDDLRFYYECGVDAVLVQDFGVLTMLRNYFPDLPIHASTQMNIASSYGAEFLARCGVKRIVAARELSLEEIRILCTNTGAEIEVFVHGALCVCYSGQCLMSSFLGGRSGNRGRCAQPCRLPYRVLDEHGNKFPTPGKYMLSPKDLCGVAELPALIEAGVRSLKIEGRMKQAAYAQTVTSVYRKYVDLYLERGKDAFAVSDEDRELLLASGSRNGFTNAYFFTHNTPEMMSFSDSSHGKNPAKESVPKPFDENIPIAGQFVAKIGEPLSLTAYCVQTRNFSADALRTEEDAAATVVGTVCEQAQRQPVSEADIREKLNKTGNSPFRFASLAVEADTDAFIPLKEINRLRREVLDELYQKLAAPFHRKADTTVDFREMSVSADLQLADKRTEPKRMLRVSNQEQLEIAEKCSWTDMVALPVSLFENIGGKETTKRYIFELPVVFRQETAEQYRKFVAEHRSAEYEASSYDALGFLQEMGIPMSRIHAGYRLYMPSDRTREAFCGIGIVHGGVPLELSEKELGHRDNRQDRMLIYGRVPLIYTANCVAKNIGKCTKTTPRCFLQDRKGKTFPVICDCATCTNIIYNAVPTDLIDRYRNIKALQPEAVEIALTTENHAEAEAVLKRAQKAIEGENEIALPSYEFTRGHFTKSIE